MTEEKILSLIQETDMLISTMYRMVDNHTGLTEDQVMRVYEEIDKKEVYLDELVSLYENKTGKKIPYDEKEGRYIFENVIPQNKESENIILF